MRYAIPVSDDMVASHFGHCDHFALIDVDERAKHILKKEIVSSPGHQPGFLPKWLAEQGVSFVIANGMGSRAQSLFQQNLITVIIGAIEPSPERAVLKHLNGHLATGNNICDH